MMTMCEHREFVLLMMEVWLSEFLDAACYTTDKFEAFLPNSAGHCTVTIAFPQHCVDAWRRPQAQMKEKPTARIVTMTTLAVKVREISNTFIISITKN